MSHPHWRSIYRFWHDLGYGIGALGFGLVPWSCYGEKSPIRD